MIYQRSKLVPAALSVAMLLLAGCAAQPRLQAEAAPLAAPRPSGLPELARCLRGQDSAGAHYLIAIPAQWSMARSPVPQGLRSAVVS